MSYKFITTSIDQQLICALLDSDERLVEVNFLGHQSDSIVGNIYVGQVKTIKRNIQSAFVDIGIGQNVFVSLGESNRIFYTKKHGKGDHLVQGDEILVQIEKDAHKTKLAKAVTDFSLSGKYIVLTTDRSGVFVSSKIRNDKIRLALKHALKPYVKEGVGFICRTNSGEVEAQIVIDEANELVKQYEELLKVMSYRKSGQMLLGHEKPYHSVLNNLYDAQVSDLVYDDQDIYKEVLTYVNKTMPSLVEKVQFSDHSIAKGFNIKAKLDKLTRKKSLAQIRWFHHY